MTNHLRNYETLRERTKATKQGSNQRDALKFVFKNELTDVRKVSFTADF